MIVSVNYIGFDYYPVASLQYDRMGTWRVGQLVLYSHNTWDYGIFSSMIIT